MSRKTTTTTVVHSEKDKDGNWSEFSKTVTTVVERDDDGNPYGPLASLYGYNPFVRRSKSGLIGDYLTWYDALGARPAKKQEPEQEDGQDG
ncbi:hypothetical protein [Streptomyces sp. NPDC002758]